jgi:hypothetical protein
MLAPTYRGWTYPAQLSLRGAMARRQLIGIFVGVPDEMLRTIGMIVVMTAQLGATRMKLLEVTRSIPVADSARMKHKEVTKAIRQAFDSAPLSPMKDRVDEWLSDAESLFQLRNTIVHSTGGFETRGDGAQRFVREHPRDGGTKPQLTSIELDDVVLRLSDATGDGFRLSMDAGVLVGQGSAAYDELMTQRERLREEREALLADALPAATGEDEADTPAPS